MSEAREWEGKKVNWNQDKAELREWKQVTTKKKPQQQQQQQSKQRVEERK